MKNGTNSLIANQIESYEKSMIFKSSGVLKASNSKYPEQCTIKWEGHSSPASIGHVSIDYTSGTLNMAAMVYGTPVFGKACTINVFAENFEFKSGDKKQHTLIVDGANFKKDIPMEVTPAAKYKGKNLKFTVCIGNAASSSVLYARVGW